MAATELIGQRGSYVDGRWVGGDKVLAVENPADETTVCELLVTPLDEIRRAVRPPAVPSTREAGPG